MMSEKLVWLSGLNRVEFTMAGSVTVSDVLNINGDKASANLVYAGFLHSWG
jgi:hypothetical protein